MKRYYVVSVRRYISLLWSLLFVSVLLFAYANTCLTQPVPEFVKLDAAAYQSTLPISAFWHGTYALVMCLLLAVWLVRPAGGDSECLRRIPMPQARRKTGNAPRPNQWLFSAYLFCGLALFSNAGFGQSTSYISNTTVNAKMAVTNSYAPRNTIYLANEIQQAIPPDALNVYGGWTGMSFPTTGFFRVEKINGVWRMIDPLGNPFISKGLNSVKPDNTTLADQKMLSIFGTRANWATAAASQLKGLSFNTLGSWSDNTSVNTVAHPIPYSNVVYMAGGYGMSVGKAFKGTGHIDFTDDLIPVFDPGFATYCTQAAAGLTAEAQNSWLIGRYSDNELPFPADALDRWLLRPAADPGNAAALNWLAARQLTPAAITDTVRAEFLEFMAEKYFQTCKNAIKAVAPNHLYLGSRFHADVKWSAPVIRAAGRHVDVISVNLYARWEPDLATMDSWETLANRPFIITEFCAKGMDSGLPNNSGAGWIVPAQVDRGLFYHNLTLSILKHPGCVGWHWFRYIDNNINDNPQDPTNTDSNKGIVNIDYQPYTALTDLMKTLNERAYRLREDFTFPQPSPVITASSLLSLLPENAGTTNVFTLTRTGAVTSPLNVAVSWSGAAIQGVDYTTPNLTSVTFAAGASTVNLAVTPVDDGLTEEAEDIVLKPLPAAAYTVLSGQSASVLIRRTLGIEANPPMIAISDKSSLSILPPKGVASTCVWSKLSGPGTATFSTPTAFTTNVSFTQYGVYLLKAAVTAGGITTTESVEVTVERLVSIKNGRLSYTRHANAGETEAVNVIPDFSRCGYREGGVAIPQVPTKITLTPSGGSDRAAIQNAINQVSAMPLDANGFRGAVLLKAGTFITSDSSGCGLQIRASGVVVRGEGQGPGGTKLMVTVNARHNSFYVAGSEPSYSEPLSSRTRIADNYVGGGAMSFRVENASGLQAGDAIRVYFTPNATWLTDIHVNDFLQADDTKWTTATYTIPFERTITKIIGNEVFLDSPVVVPMQKKYGGGEVRKIVKVSGNRLSNIGVENLSVSCPDNPAEAKNRISDAVLFEHVENSWISGVTVYHQYDSAVTLTNSRYITVQDCASLKPVGPKEGGYRYTYYIGNKSNHCLVQRCYAYDGRHDFVVDAYSPGPNVFLDCLSELGGTQGPHQRFASGILYDNLKSASRLAVSENRGTSGTGHGWTGVTDVSWNSTASFTCDAPKGFQNYAIGSVGTEVGGDYITNASPYVWRGLVENKGTPVATRSLYLKQLEDRLGTLAVDAVTTAAQRSGSFQTYPKIPIITPSVSYLFNGQSQFQITSDYAGAVIRYTTDGSQPTVTSPVYTPPLVINQVCTIKASAFDAAGRNSPVAQAVTLAPMQPLVSAPSLVNPGLLRGEYASQLVDLADMRNGKVAPTAVSVTSGFVLPTKLAGERFSLMFKGYLDVPTAGFYTFYFSVDEIARLYINNQQILEGKLNNTATQNQVQVALNPGRFEIDVDYANSFQVVNSTQSLGLTWSGPGIAKSSIAANLLSHNAAQASIGSLSPVSGTTAGGTTVTITGTNLTGTTAVSFGGTAATGVTVVSPTTVTCVTPARAGGAVDVLLIAPGGWATKTAGYSYVTYATAPTITSLSPVSGTTAGGTTVTITGTNLTGTTAVTFGGTAATAVTVVSATSVTCVTPAKAAGAVNVVLTAPGGSVTKTTGYTYVTPAPTLTSLSPVSGTTVGGTTVTITGTNLTGTTAVTFGGTAATGVTVVSATSVTCVTPAKAAGAVNVVLTTPGGSVTKTAGYTYATAPTLTSLSPVSGTTAGGTTVTITGTNLTGTTAVTFGGTAATAVTVVSATSVTCVTPAKAAGAVNVVLTAPGGSVTKTTGYTYVTPAPTITSLSPVSGTTVGGTTVTITGTNLTGTTSVTFGGTAATAVTVVSATSVTCVTPAKAAGAVNVVLTTPGGSVTKTTGYTYATAPTITSLSPVSGTTAGGTTVTITGTNLTGTTAVTFGGTAATAVTVVSATSVTCVTPAKAAGAVNVVLTAPGGSVTKTTGYTYVTPPAVVNAGQDQVAYLSTVSFSPADVGALAWYDASDASTITQASGAVSQWASKAGSSHMLQATTTKQPTSGSYQINGLNTIAFDGTDDALKTASNPFGTSISNAMILGVFNVGTVNTDSTLFSLSSSTTNRWQSHTPYSDGILYFDCGGASAPNRVSKASGFAASQNRLLGYYCSTTANVQQVWVNGTNFVSDTSGHTVNTSGGIALGHDGTSSYDNCRMGEVVIINGTVSETNRQKLEGYLAHKWGMAASLPAGHSYLNAAPTVDKVIVQLNGTASDGTSNPLAIGWSVVSGPGTVNFANPSAASTQATFLLEGVYTLRLSGNNGTLATDDVVITVKLNKVPVVNAGPDRTVASLSSLKWSPLDLSPGLWLDASKATLNASTVSIPNAGTGGGTLSGPASLTANGINNLQTVQFNGSSQYLTGAYANTGNTLSAFFVGKSASTTQAAYAGMMSVWASGQTNEWNNVGSAVLFNQNNTTANSLQTYRNSTSLSATTGTLTNPFMAATVFSGSTNTMFLNGTTANVANSSGNFNASNVVLGSRWENSAFSTGWNGSMGEAIIFNANLSGLDRQKVEGYLAHRWGLAAGLPADHPYKIAAPGPPAIVTLNGAASDVDGLPLPMTTTWILVSGPQPVVFTNPKAVITDALFTAPGVYRFRLTADDSLDQVMDECLITISSAVVVDGDMDGMNDAWEIANFGGIGASNGSGDSDGDGSSDQQEFLAGTNPNDSNSLLKITSTTTISKTEMVLTFNAVAGKTYKLLASSNLTASSWQPIQTGIIGVSPTTSVTVPITGGSKFFIIGVE